jgi:hypothetical protein
MSMYCAIEELRQGREKIKQPLKAGGGLMLQYLAA